MSNNSPSPSTVDVLTNILQVPHKESIPNMLPIPDNNPVSDKIKKLLFNDVSEPGIVDVGANYVTKIPIQDRSSTLLIWSSSKRLITLYVKVISKALADEKSEFHSDNINTNKLTKSDLVGLIETFDIDRIGAFLPIIAGESLDEIRSDMLLSDAPVVATSEGFLLIKQDDETILVGFSTILEASANISKIKQYTQNSPKYHILLITGNR